MGNVEVARGDRVEYIAHSGSDGTIAIGDVAWVTEIDRGRVWAIWPRGGVQSVPIAHIRRLAPEVMRSVAAAANVRTWPLLGEALLALSNGRPRNPYLEQGCHPDIVVRVWDELGSALRCDCRAQANGTPVLAHPETDRIIAVAHGTAYALWLTAEDRADAIGAGATPRPRSGAPFPRPHELAIDAQSLVGS